MSARIIPWPTIPRLRISGEHPPKHGQRSATIIILPLIRIERLSDPPPKRRRRRLSAAS